MRHAGFLGALATYLPCTSATLLLATLLFATLLLATLLLSQLHHSALTLQSASSLLLMSQLQIPPSLNFNTFTATAVSQKLIHGQFLAIYTLTIQSTKISLYCKQCVNRHPAPRIALFVRSLVTFFTPSKVHNISAMKRAYSTNFEQFLKHLGR